MKIFHPGRLSSTLPLLVASVVGTSVPLFPQDSPNLRVAVTLVQVDAVVTDRNGRPVNNLTKDDFLLFEDGKPRKITSFSYASTATSRPGPAPQLPGRPASTPSVQPNQVRRSIALVVDDLQMSFSSVNYAQQALLKFVDQQMTEGDLVAIILTSGGSASLQQFTADKNLLHAAINKVRFRLTGRGEDGGTQAIGTPVDDDRNGLIGSLERRRFAVGTFGTIRYISAAMRDLPGRKSLVLFSDGFSLTQRRDKPPPVTVDDARKVSDSANRSAVVIYSVDVRGLVYGGLKAQDNVGGLEPDQVIDAINARGEKFRDNQEGLQFLAAETGGRAMFQNNDLNAALSQMLIDEEGYYLLGFQPAERDAARITRANYTHRLTVKLTRPDLQVRYRKAYMGGQSPSDSPATTPMQRLLSALRSPFAGNGISLRLTPGFVLGEKGQPAIQALVHIRGADLQFSPPDAQGVRSTRLDIVAVSEGDGATADSSTQRSYTVRVNPDSFDNLRRDGLVYAIQHEIKKPGPYNFRIALLDEQSGAIGSASRFLEIPDVAKGSFAISGVTMCDGDWRSTNQLSPEADRSRATRTFQRGRPFSFGVTVYNAHYDSKTKSPAVDLSARLLRDNKVIWQGKSFPVVATAGADPRRLPGASVLQLEQNSTPGEYLLEVTATERTGKHPSRSQWIEFELR